jgi:hypothetical protein
MSGGSILPRVREWLLRPAALRAAREAVAGPQGRRQRAREQAQLLAEVARRVAEPVEALPVGAGAAVQLSLYRDAAYWALTAFQPAEAEAPDLASLWAEMPADRLQHAAGGAEAAEAARRALTNRALSRTLDAADEDAARARKFVDALFVELDQPRRRLERVTFQRWSRIGLVAIALLAAVYGIRMLALGPNLAADKPWRASSTYAGCNPSSPCDGIFFHTEQETNPWVEFDLGAPKSVKRIEVANRGDCCEDRAVPLIAEVSLDRTHWTEVARRDSDFTNWTASFSKKTARYVRLRVPRATQFHLKQVAVR